jgi:hypothetical protein
MYVLLYFLLFTYILIHVYIFHRFYCDVPDEFLFTNLATLTELALAVRNGNGTLTPAQKAQIDSETPSDETDNQKGVSESTLEIEATGKASHSTATKKGKKGAKVKKGGNQGKSTVIEQGNPWCPWFVCCY